MISRQVFADTLQRELVAGGLPLDDYDESCRRSDLQVEFTASNFAEYIRSHSPGYSTVVDIKWVWTSEDAIRSSGFGARFREDEHLKEWDKIVFVTMAARLSTPKPVHTHALERWRNTLVAEFGEWVPLSDCIGKELYCGRLPLTLAFATPLDRGNIALSYAESFSRHEITLWKGGVDASWEDSIRHIGRNLGAAWGAWCKHAARLTNLR